MSQSNKISVKDKCTEVLDEFFMTRTLNENGPVLEPFAPEPDALFSELFIGDKKKTTTSASDGTTDTGQEVYVPSDPKEKSHPRLLLYDLKNHAKHKETAAYKHIENSKQKDPMILYGTSGAGKTRSIYEYLSQNKGFYFLAGDSRRNAGSTDLFTIFLDLDAVAHPVTAEGISKSTANLDIVRQRVEIIIYVRILVHQYITKELKKDITPYEWLLYQLYPNVFLDTNPDSDIDIFLDAVAACSDYTTVDMKSAAAPLRSELQKAEWQDAVPFIDEAQLLLSNYKAYFLSAIDENKQRSGFSAVLKAFINIHAYVGHKRLGWPVFSGTGLSLDEFLEQHAYASGKEFFHGNEDPPSYFVQFDVLDETAVQEYVSIFLKLTDVEDKVIGHVAKWLRGRPRFTATFVERYLVRKAKKTTDNTFEHPRGNFTADVDKVLMQGLDRYLAAMTTGGKRTGGSGAFRSGNSAYDSYVNVHKRAMPEDNGETTLKDDMKSCVLKFAVGGKHVYFQGGAISMELIEKGVAAVSLATPRGGAGIVGALDEPIMVEAGLNYYNVPTYTTKRKMIESLQDGKGRAFQELLLSPLHENDTWQGFLKPELGDDHKYKDFSVSSRSSYGVLALSCKGDIDRTIEWIKKSIGASFDGQVPPFCFPDDSFGPDIMFLMWNEAYSEFRPVLVQSKFAIKLLAEKEASLTVDPELLYHESRGDPEKQKPSRMLNKKNNSKLWNSWNAVKPSLFGDNNPFLRVLVQYPSVGKEATQKGLKRMHEAAVVVDTLVCVDGSNAHLLFTQDVIELLKAEKGSPKAKKLRRKSRSG